MLRRVLFVAAVFLALAGSAQANGITFRPGAPGIGDPYFPLDGNGGYDATHYDLNVAYDPKTDVLRGLATIDITAKQDLSSFNLDLHGLTVRTILIDGSPARWSRGGDELTITPRKRHPARGGLHRADRLRRRAGDDRRRRDRALRLHPHRRRDARRRPAGRRRDVVPGQRSPARQGLLHVPHPRPARPVGDRQRRAAGRRQPRAGDAWRWEAKEPMASYLTTATIGEFDVKQYKTDGIKVLDAIDPDLDTRAAAAHRAPVRDLGHRRAVLQAAGADDQRARRAAAGCRSGSSATPSPTGTASSSRPTRAGQDDWTTLRDLNGHNAQSPGTETPTRASGSCSSTRSSSTT